MTGGTTKSTELGQAEFAAHTKYLTRRLLECLAEVERLAAINGMPDDAAALLANYRRLAPHQDAAAMTMPLQLWTALAVLEGIRTDILSFKPDEHIAIERVQFIEQKTVSRSPKARGVRGGADVSQAVKLTDRKVSRALADEYMRAQDRVLRHYNGYVELDRAASELESSLRDESRGTPTVQIARTGLQGGARPEDLAAYALMRRLVVRERDRPEDFVCERTRSAANAAQSRGPRVRDTAVDDNEVEKLLIDRMYWTPGVKKMGAHKEVAELLKVSSSTIERAARRIEKRRRHDALGTGMSK